MKTKTIFTVLALATLLPISCGKNEIPNEKGYPLSVTLNVTRQGDEAATRATYNDGTKTLAFGTGDQLFVLGSHSTAGKFAGTLAWQSGETFTGTILTKNLYSGTSDDLFKMATYTRAALVPKDYASYGYLEFDKPDTYSATLFTNFTDICANTKASAVEQLSFEYTESYSSPTGFALSPQNAIINFIFTGLPVNTDATIYFECGSYIINKAFRADGTGKVSFFTIVEGGANASSINLTVNGQVYSFPSKVLEAGHIYTVSRTVPSTP